MEGGHSGVLGWEKFDNQNGFRGINFQINESEGQTSKTSQRKKYSPLILVLRILLYAAKEYLPGCACG